MSQVDICDFLFERWKNLALWRNLWTILLFLLGIAFTIFLIGAVLFFVRESWLPGALLTVSTVADGVAVGWILARRNQAVAEESAAKDDLLKNCASASAGAMRGFTGEVAAPSPVNSAVEAVERRLKLFGRFR